MDGPAVRKLGREDLDALLALYRHLHAQDDPLPPRSHLEATWDGIVANESYIYLGAFVGEELAAACNAAIIANLTRGARPYAVIENVVTHPSHRRRGIGALLLREMLERCRLRRCYKVTLTSARGRAEYWGFYEAVGFDRDAKQAFVVSMR